MLKSLIVPMLAGALALAGLMTPAFAVDGTPPTAEAGCQDYAALHDRIAAHYSNAIFVPLTAEQQATVENFLNAQPPVSDDHFDHMIVVATPEIPSVLILIFTTKTCVRYEQAMPMRVFEGLIQGA